MPNDVIERDPYEQERFGQYLQGFCDEMRTICGAIKAHVEDAESCIGDSNAKGALEDVKTMAQDILNLLPGIEEFGQKQIVLSKPVQEAQEFKFTRH